MRTEADILAKLKNTSLDGEETAFKVGELIRREFDKTQDEQRAFEMLQIAYNFNVPQLEEMLSDYSLEDFRWL